MSRALIVAGAFVAGACGGGAKKPPAEPVANVQPAQAPAEPPPMSDTDQVFAVMQRFEKDMCACAPKDSSCAQRVSDAMTKWSQDMQATRPNDREPVRMTQEQTERATKIATHMGECMQAAMGT